MRLCKREYTDRGSLPGGGLCLTFKSWGSRSLHGDPKWRGAHCRAAVVKDPSPPNQLIKNEHVFRQNYDNYYMIHTLNSPNSSHLFIYPLVTHSNCESYSFPLPTSLFQS